MTQANLIRKEDVLDSDFFDAYELSSDGYKIYYTGANVIITVSTTKTVFVSGITQSNRDNNVQSGDRVHLYGTSAADGYYYIDSVLNDTSFTVTTPILDSTGGFCDYIYPAAAKLIGLDPSGMTHVHSHNVQDAIKELDMSIGSSSSGGITADQHAALRQLIHLADGIGGPFEGFLSGAYREVSGSLTFPTNLTWYTDVGKTRKIVDKTIVYTPAYAIRSTTWNVYFEDGVTLAATAVDTITNSGVFEQSRIRTIIDYSLSPDVLSAESHKSLRQLIHLVDGAGGPFESFATGAYRESNPVGPFPTSFIWYTDNTKAQKIVEKNLTYNSQQIPIVIQYKVYDTDGVTLLHTVTDVPSYSGVFEMSRVRTIV